MEVSLGGVTLTAGGVGGEPGWLTDYRGICRLRGPNRLELRWAPACPRRALP